MKKRVENDEHCRLFMPALQKKVSMCVSHSHITSQGPTGRTNPNQFLCFFGHKTDRDNPQSASMIIKFVSCLQVAVIEFFLAFLPSCLPPFLSCLG